MYDLLLFEKFDIVLLDKLLQYKKNEMLGNNKFR